MAYDVFLWYYGLKCLQRPRLLPHHKFAHLDFARENQTWDIERWKTIQFYSLMRKNLTWIVLMASNIIGMTLEMLSTWHSRGGSIMIFFLQWSFWLYRGVRQWQAMWRCCRGHHSWRTALICTVMTRSLNRTMLQFTTPTWQRTSSRRITMLFWTILRVPRSMSHWGTFRMDGKGSLPKWMSVPDHGCPLWTSLHYLE